MPSVQVNDPHSSYESIVCRTVVIVKSKVTKLSQPLMDVNMKVAEVFSVYVLPSIHVKLPQAS